MLKQTKTIALTNANELQKKKKEANYLSIICNSAWQELSYWFILFSFLYIIFIVQQPNPNIDLVNGSLDVKRLN